MPRCFIGLGGNLGRVDDTFERALEALRALPDVTLGPVSRFLRTFPVGENSGEPFLNAAAELSTAIEPAALISQLQAVEEQFGRERTVHWGPRTLDIDLLFYGSEVVAEPHVTVPHPAVWYRRFVLDPLAQIATDFVHPIKGISVRHLRERLLVRPLPIAFAGASFSERQRLLALIGREFPDVWPIEWIPGQPRPLDPRAEPKIVVWLGATRLGERVQKSVRGAADGPATEVGQSFDALPFLSRVDATACSGSVLQFVRDILNSALGS